MASRLILVSVLPVLMVSPIWNCHLQMLGSPATATVYSMPLCIIGNPRLRLIHSKFSYKLKAVCSILLVDEFARAVRSECGPFGPAMGCRYRYGSSAETACSV